MKSHEDFSNGITEELLRQDAVIAERAVLRLINVPLTDSQFDALVSLPTIWAVVHYSVQHYEKKVNREHHELVPREFRKWVWAGSRKLKGLVRRREAEAELYMYG